MDFVLYLQYFAVLSVFMLVQFIASYLDGYAFAWQIKRHEDVTEKYLSFWDNGAMWADVLFFNVFLSYYVPNYAPSWPLLGFAMLLVVSACVGMVLQMPLLWDSKTTYSAWTRDGMLTLAGGMHYVYFVAGMAVALSVFLLTPSADISPTSAVVAAVWLGIHQAYAVMQPPKKVHGKIHGTAWGVTIFTWLILAGLTGHLLQYY